ncbi:paired amphipathic helix protein Sin3-like 5 [Panicum miliaceum]|uniref:Paired amphipathic helix protein Sin3-like 5 n=1 Tax=Panicum miliaceum TaxID=4540 RepID=A0A3L6T3Q8_PANMI|nr:paired amphipathic helix protein Sin3-like 5 [Panicum miliaceum]
MAPSGDPSDEDLHKRALENHRKETVGFLILAKSILSDDAYKDLIKTSQEIVKQSSCTEGGITAKKCEEILSEVFSGQNHVLKGFHHFLDGRDPFHDHDSQQSLQCALSFLSKVKESPCISHEDYNDFIATLTQFIVTKTVGVEDVCRKVKRAMHRCPEFIHIFENFLSDCPRVTLPNEQSHRSPKTSPTDNAVLCFTPDANHSLDCNRTKTSSIKCNVSQVGHPHDQDHEETEYNFRQRHTQRILDSFETPTKGNGESLHAEEYEGDKTDPLPDWSSFRRNDLPPKVNLDMCTRCTTSYYLLPKNVNSYKFMLFPFQLIDNKFLLGHSQSQCLTLKSSYRTELGQSIFNDTLVLLPLGGRIALNSELKIIMKKIFSNAKTTSIYDILLAHGIVNDQWFESDMLLQRYKATTDFIGNLQDNVDSAMKIQEYLTPLHRRCIEQLYDEHGLDMLDALWENIDTSTALVILHSRLNQKIDDLSEARLSLNKTCSNIIANNYHRSLDHRSSSFKQLDKRRMSPKALLAEAREINMERLNNGDRHLSSACNNQSSLISENVPKDTELHIHNDIDKMLPESNGTVSPKEACEHCGLGKNSLRSIPQSSFATNIPLSSMRGGYLVNTPNRSASIQDACQTEIEEGEFIPDVGNIQLGSMLGPENGAASYDVPDPSEAGSSFRCPGSSIYYQGNKSEVHHESREGCNVEMGSLAYSKRPAEPHDVNGGIPCCSLVALLRLHQILYERLLVAKVLSAKARDKAPSRGLGTCDVYAGFKEELFNLLTGASNNSNFEKYCLTFLGPKSYVLFTLNEVMARVIKQVLKTARFFSPMKE